MKSINLNAPVKASKTIFIEAKPSKVWEVLSNINQWPQWQSDITKSKLNGALAVGSTFDWKTGGANIHSTLHTVIPNRSLGWTGKAFGLYAIHNWKLEEVNGITQLIVEESMEGFLAKLLKNMLHKNLDKGMQLWLDLLKKECEG